MLQKKGRINLYVDPTLKNAGFTALSSVMINLLNDCYPGYLFGVRENPGSEHDLNLELFGGITDTFTLPSFRTIIPGRSLRKEEATPYGISEIINTMHMQYRMIPKKMMQRVYSADPELNRLNKNFLYAEQASELMRDAGYALGDDIRAGKRFANRKWDEKASDIITADINDFLAKSPDSSIAAEHWDFVNRTLSKTLELLKDGRAPAPGMEPLKAEVQASYELHFEALKAVLQGRTFVMDLPFKSVDGDITAHLQNTIISNSKNDPVNLLEGLWAIEQAGNRIEGRIAQEYIDNVLGARTEEIVRMTGTALHALPFATLEESGTLDMDSLLLNSIRTTYAHMTHRHKESLARYVPYTKPELARTVQTLLGWIGYRSVDGKLIDLVEPGLRGERQI